MSRVLCALLLVVIATAQPPARTACLVVHVDGVRADGQDLRVAVFNQARGFPSDSALAATGMRAAASATELTLTFCDLPYGRYAVAMHHDENGNHVMDHNWLHIPTEGYGLSNNIRPRFGPPRFAACAIEVAADTVPMTVHMHY